METQRAELLKLLPEHGWRVALIEDNLEWWADEMWHLESVWSPVGSRAYITFLVDPMFEGHRRKGEGVWGVMASPYKPVNSSRGSCESVMSLGSGWKNDLPGLLGFMQTLRGVNTK